MRLVVFTLLSTILATLAATTCPKNEQVNAYYPAYNQQLSDIPWSGLDLVYYFVAVSRAYGVTIPKDQVKMGAFVREARKQGKKPIFTIGGWTGSKHFSDLTATAAARSEFAKHLAGIVKGYGMDGIDIDWEYPNSAGIGCNRVRPEDTANFLEFLKVLRIELGPKMIIGAAVSQGGILGPDGTPLADLTEMGDLLDYLTLMTYDTYGSWSETTGPNAPLYDTCSDQAASVDTSVNFHIDAGFPACKILVGIPSYSYSFTTTNSTLAVAERNGKKSLMFQDKLAEIPRGDSNDVKTPAGTFDICGTENPAGYAGGWTYNTMVSEGILSNDGKKGLKGFTRYWDSCSMTPLLFNKSTRQFIAYEDAASVLSKAKYAKSKGLAGVIVFDSMGFSKGIYETARAGLKSASKRALPL